MLEDGTPNPQCNPLFLALGEPPKAPESLHGKDKEKEMGPLPTIYSEFFL